MSPWNLSAKANCPVIDKISDNADLLLWNARREWTCWDFLNLSLSGSLHPFFLQGRGCLKIFLVWVLLFWIHFYNFLWVQFFSPTFPKLSAPLMKIVLLKWEIYKWDFVSPSNKKYFLILSNFFQAVMS